MVAAQLYILPQNYIWALLAFRKLLKTKLFMEYSVQLRLMKKGNSKWNEDPVTFCDSSLDKEKIGSSPNAPDSLSS